MRLIFSRDRAAQLDLLSRSLGRYAEPEFTRLLYWATTEEFQRGYDEVGPLGYPNADFNQDLRGALVNCSDETVTFFCDDDVAYRNVPHSPGELLVQDDQLLCLSLRLGRGNQQMRLPDGFPVWRWHGLPRHDFGFPGSIDGHTFRVKDVLAMIGREPIENPKMLETVLALRCEMFRSQRPLMGCFQEQCLVGVPVNRVSEQSGVPYGKRFPQSTGELNVRWLGGERISLEALDFSGVDSCHQEVEFVWEPRP